MQILANQKPFFDTGFNVLGQHEFNMSLLKNFKSTCWVLKLHTNSKNKLINFSKFNILEKYRGATLN